MEDTRYTYAVAKIRELERSLLTTQTLKELLEASDEESIFRLLRSTVYAVAKEGLEEEFRDEYRKTISLLKRLSLDSLLTKLMAIRYDFHNLKVLVKAKHFKSEEVPMLAEEGSIGSDELQQALREDRMRSLPDFIVKAVVGAEDAFRKSGESRIIDMVLDREFGNVFHRFSLEYGHKFFIDFSTCFSDLANIRNFFRIRKLGERTDLLDKVLLENGKLEKNLFVSYAEHPLEEFVNRMRSSDYADIVREGNDYLRSRGSLSRLERLTEEWLLRFLERSRLVVFGPEPIFAYLLFKENEVRSLRTIVFGKLGGAPTDVIRERIPFLS